MVSPYDDPDIQPGDTIIRRINPEYQTVYDGNTGVRRISSVAYSPSSGTGGGMSVDIEKRIVNAGYDPVSYVTNPTYTGSVWFTAEQIRLAGLRIGYEPLPDNIAHGEVWPPTGSNSFTKGQKRTLARSARWFHRIDGVELY